MRLFYIVIWGFAAVCGLTAVGALVWAVRSGQLRSFAAGATSIFDDEEPIGTTTDGFPRAPVEPISRGSGGGG